MRSLSGYGFFAPVFVLFVASLSGCGSDQSSGDPVSQGTEAVTARACKSCHGAPDGSLSGQKNAQPNTTAYPANLTPDSETGIGDWTVDTIVNAVLNGIDDEGAHLCPPMPVFASAGMTMAEAQSIATYLKSLPPVTNEIPESKCAGKM